MGKDYISNVYQLHDCSYHVTEKGYISERNHSTKRRRSFQISQEDTVRLQKIALNYKPGNLLQAERVRDIFYDYVIQSMSTSRKTKPR